MESIVSFVKEGEAGEAGDPNMVHMSKTAKISTVVGFS